MENSQEIIEKLEARINSLENTINFMHENHNKLLKHNTFLLERINFIKNSLSKNFKEIFGVRIKNVLEQNLPED